MSQITVDAENLRQVLQAFMGSSHHVMELFILRDSVNSPVNRLVKEYNQIVTESKKESSNG